VGRKAEGGRKEGGTRQTRPGDHPGEQEATEAPEAVAQTRARRGATAGGMEQGTGEEAGSLQAESGE